MKRFFTLLAAGLLLLASCDPNPVLSLNPETLTFSAEGGSESIAVTANNSWNILLENSEDFFTVSPLSGSVQAQPLPTLACGKYDKFFQGIPRTGP